MHGLDYFAFLLTGDTSIPFAMLLVFGSAKLLAEICERFGQPGIVGEILAGVLIGPSVLGWLAPNDFLGAMANMGAMFLLFRVGLEVKSSELMRVGGTATLVATAGVIAPFLLGWGILLLWGAPQIEAIFMGAAMVATSVGITAQVLASRGLLGERSSQVILAAAVIDDVQGLLVLAVVSSMARGKFNLADILLTATLAIGFTVVLTIWGGKAMGKVVNRAQGNMHVAEAEFAISLVLLFGLSLLAVYVGVAAIVGAFLAGMALAEHVEPRVHDLAHGVSELMVPFFLVGIGLHVDLRIFTTPSVLMLALVVLLAAVATKLVAWGLAAWRLGRVDALRVGLGMVPRGEVGMVVAQIGLSLGAIHQQTYGVAVFMAVATTILAPPLIKIAYRDAGRPATAL
jgi:Kef-type K+ transport system membrane component KefB